MDEFVQQRAMKTLPSFSALVLRALLLIGGVEPNPGPVDKASCELCGDLLEVTNAKNGAETTAMKKKLLEDYKDRVSKLEEDLGLKDKVPATPISLQNAVYWGNLPDLRYILQTGKLSVEHRFADRKTPLILASERGHLSLVRYLVAEAGACVNARDNLSGRSALHWAAYGGHRSVVVYLVTLAEMDPSEKTALSETPLHLAAERGHLHVVKYLWEKCNLTFAVTNDGWTPLHFACRAGHLDVVMYLVTVAKMDPSKKTALSETPLHLAAKGGFLNVMQFLVGTADVSIHDKDSKGMCAVHFAAEHGHLHVVKYLWETCDKTPFGSTNDGWTPLHFACHAGRRDVVRYLVEEYAVDKNAVDSSGCNAVSYVQGTNWDCSVIREILS